MKYNKGDKVKVLVKNGLVGVGVVGTITAISHSPQFQLVFVKFYAGMGSKVYDKAGWFGGETVELVEIKKKVAEETEEPEEPGEYGDGW